MINGSAMMRAQKHSSGRIILGEWQQRKPGMATMQAVEPITRTVDGPEFDAVWMVLALQALLPHRFTYNGRIGIGNAITTHANQLRLGKAIAAARTSDHDAVLRNLTGIAKAHHFQESSGRTLSMMVWAQDTADALSGDLARIRAVCEKWTAEYTRLLRKQHQEAQGE